MAVLVIPAVPTLCAQRLSADCFEDNFDSVRDGSKIILN